LAFHPVLNVRKKAILGHQTPKMFVNFNESHYLYSMDLNTLSAPNALPSYQAQISCKADRVHNMKAHGGVWVQLHSFLTSALDGD
jgi:hypothetical protein